MEWSMDWLEVTFRTGGDHIPELSFTTVSLHRPSVYVCVFVCVFVYARVCVKDVIVLVCSICNFPETNAI